jgi:hypothetical protein
MAQRLWASGVLGSLHYIERMHGLDFTCVASQVLRDRVMVFNNKTVVFYD